jgi:hypothetical protein
VFGVPYAAWVELELGSLDTCMVLLAIFNRKYEVIDTVVEHFHLIATSHNFISVRIVPSCPYNVCFPH